MCEIYIIRVLFSLLLGILIGIERQITGHKGGIKTNALICFGACLFTTFSYLVDGTDKTRVAAQVVSGVGFLCSGVIFKDKEKESVSGLSTSATIWVSAAIGVITSAGYLEFSFIVTIILIFSNLIIAKFSVIKAWDIFDDSTKVYQINISCNENMRGIVKELIMKTIDNDLLTLSNLDTENENGISYIKSSFLHTGKRCDHVIEELISKILLEEGVISAGWECFEN